MHSMAPGGDLTLAELAPSGGPRVSGGGKHHNARCASWPKQRGSAYLSHVLMWTPRWGEEQSYPVLQHTVCG